jgi:hypothetical protein
MCVKAANKRLQADIGISLATWKITLSSALCEDNTLDWEAIRDESQHGTVDVAYPGTAGEWLALSEGIPSCISALRCCLRRFTLNAAPPSGCRWPPANTVEPMTPDAG